MGDSLEASWSLTAPGVFGETFLLFKSEANVAVLTTSFCEFATLKRDDFKVTSA